MHFFTLSIKIPVLANGPYCLSFVFKRSRSLCNCELTYFFIDEPTRIQERADAVELEFRESMMNRIEGGYMLAGQTEVFLREKDSNA